MRVTSRGALALTSLALLAGCGDGPTPPKPQPAVGSFTATVSGAASRSLDGQAGFLVTTNLFTIALNSSAGSGSIQLSRLSGVPAAGTYSLDANAAQNSGAFAAIYSAGAQENYVSTSGSLTITSSSGDRVRGSFDFTGTGGTSGTASVRITGTFDAPRLSAK
ncbi:MAG: hypothetical protein HOQ11_14900 [Gemmatimonadaceae bacterium]|nr:hypothetical protein [Gemmatimonadaceae bacterium]NUQ94848.1 hypothetical protein [Gemmatimonadaceae bacterium]NUR17904.1 hypothetical protein [Gemmatimonadaceae bacterium]NUS98688.1 hypothetical protein [Gemmatimonadaceae bacterium]